MFGVILLNPKCVGSLDVNKENADEHGSVFVFSLLSTTGVYNAGVLSAPTCSTYLSMSPIFLSIELRRPSVGSTSSSANL